MSGQWSAPGPYAWRRCRHRPSWPRPSEKRRERVPESRSHFARRVSKALDDPKLQKALVQEMTGLRARRSTAFNSFDFAGRRADLKRRRKANVDRLPQLPEKLKHRLPTVGAR